MNSNKTYRSSFIAVLLAALPLLTFAQKEKVAENYDEIVHNIGKMVEYIHYDPQKINDDFSRKAFESYFTSMDPGKFIFLRTDIDSFKKFENHIDNEILGDKLSLFRGAGEVYRRRLTETSDLATRILSKPFSFDKDEQYNTDRDSLDYPATKSEKEEVWRRYLKYSVLSNYNEMLNDSIATIIGNKADTAVERRAREYVLRAQQRNFKRLLDNATEQESFSQYVNAIVGLMDPHSGYFLPVDRRGFQENLSGIYYGIGALLQESEGKVKVSEPMIGGPVWRSGQVEKGDVIVSVAEGKAKAVSTEGLSMDEVIKMIRGKKGTVVSVGFRKADGKVKVVALERDALQLEDTFVRSAIIDDSTKPDHKIGYIYLPKFYTTFGDDNGRSCAFDVAAELVKLKMENVKGIVVDVRDNGGGSLGEVIRMVGLFMKTGPVVQVKARGKEVEADGVNNKSILYDGPLVVLVNEYSASASEIFAAAIQDYKRGVIVGSANTYGKGTVQRGFSVPGKDMRAKDIDLGTLHLTVQKYYRVNGGATQLKGVSPDIVLPGFNKLSHVQERYNPSALPWDTIRQAMYTPASDTAYIDVLKNKSNQRIGSDETYAKLTNTIDWLDKSSNVYSLNFQKFRAEREQISKAIRDVRSSSSLKTEMNVRNTQEDSLMLASKEEFRRENNKYWINRLKSDLYLGEAVAVLKDMLQTVNGYAYAQK
ncbi:MAG: tail-specific protease [Sphingobacteriales bacterium]|nr:MAG: tail-specific protease [Sphingobacteriales bacterium]